MTLEIVLIIVRELEAKLNVPAMVSAGREVRLLVVRKDPILELSTKVDHDPVAKLRDTKSD